MDWEKNEQCITKAQTINSDLFAPWDSMIFMYCQWGGIMHKSFLFIVEVLLNISM